MSANRHARNADALTWEAEAWLKSVCVTSSPCSWPYRALAWAFCRGGVCRNAHAAPWRATAASARGSGSTTGRWPARSLKEEKNLPVCRRSTAASWRSVAAFCHPADKLHAGFNVEDVSQWFSVKSSKTTHISACFSSIQMNVCGKSEDWTSPLIHSDRIFKF